MIQLLDIVSHLLSYQYVTDAHLIVSLWGVGSLQLYLYYEVNKLPCSITYSSTLLSVYVAILEDRPTLAQGIHLFDMAAGYSAARPSRRSCLRLPCKRYSKPWVVDTHAKVSLMFIVQMRDTTYLEQIVEHSR